MRTAEAGHETATRASLLPVRVAMLPPLVPHSDCSDCCCSELFSLRFSFWFLLPPFAFFFSSIIWPSSLSHSVASSELSRQRVENPLAGPCIETWPLWRVIRRLWSATNFEHSSHWSVLCLLVFDLNA